LTFAKRETKICCYCPIEGADQNGKRKDVAINRGKDSNSKLNQQGDIFWQCLNVSDVSNADLIEFPKKKNKKKKKKN